jgi:hypothetical protein
MLCALTVIWAKSYAIAKATGAEEVEHEQEAKHSAAKSERGKDTKKPRAEREKLQQQDR